MSSSTGQPIESRGATVEAAIDAGLRRLGLDRERVTITVIDEGSRGLLGIGSREAVVRLAPFVPAPPAPPKVERPVAPPAAERPPAPPIRPVAPPEPPAARPAPVAPPEPPTARPTPVTPPEPPAARPTRVTAAPQATDDDESGAATADQLEAEREAAIAILDELLNKMRVPANVTGYLSEPDDMTGQSVNVIDISGEDLGMLIGPRGETLDALPVPRPPDGSPQTASSRQLCG